MAKINLNDAFLTTKVKNDKEIEIATNKNVSRISQSDIQEIHQNLMRVLNIKSENEELNETLAEIKGIGTPATRANIIETIIKVDKHVLKKGKSLYPTEKGKQLVEFLPKILTEADYTAEMELELKPQQ